MMELLKDFKQYIMIIVITVVLGYFLGITVSNVLDYLLKYNSDIFKDHICLLVRLFVTRQYSHQYYIPLILYR